MKQKSKQCKGRIYQGMGVDRRCPNQAGRHSDYCDTCRGRKPYRAQPLAVSWYYGQDGIYSERRS